MARMVKPHQASLLWLNKFMNNLRHHVAVNLARWMEENPDLSSQPKVSQKSGVAQSHIGRLLREESSATVDVLGSIARAFRRQPEDLLRPPEYSTQNVAALRARDMETPEYAAVIKKLIDLANKMSPEGQHVLLGRAEEMVKQYPVAKANRAS